MIQDWTDFIFVFGMLFMGYIYGWDDGKRNKWSGRAALLVLVAAAMVIFAVRGY